MMSYKAFIFFVFCIFLLVRSESISGLDSQSLYKFEGSKNYPQKCDEPCKHGSCYFDGCLASYPWEGAKCPGGACMFNNCQFPSCKGY